MNRKETYILHHLIMIGRGKGKDLKLKEGKFRLDVRGNFSLNVYKVAAFEKSETGEPCSC